jgi:hypothetical protein
MDLVDALLAIGTEVRYVAVARGQDVTTRERASIAAASSSQSDRYEELLVNPALLTLTRQRGEIDCGGLDYLVVRYGNFFQVVIPHEGGHVSVAVESSADPVAVADRIRQVLRHP